MLRTDPRIDDWISFAKSISIEDAASFVGARLKRNGTDWAGPCPAGCASKDGFVVTPKSGLFVCRPTGEGGGPIDLVMHARGCSFLEACECLTGEPRPQGAREESASERQTREKAVRERSEAIERRRLEQENVDATDAEREAIQIERALAVMRPIVGTHAETYLRARGLSLGQWCGGFGFIAAAKYFANETVVALLPLMLAPIVFAPTGNVIGLHRTYLDPHAPTKFRPQDGVAKKFYGQAQGGLIPLGQIGEMLAVGEGIETTIAYAQNPDLGGEREGLTFAAAASLGNLSGACTGTIQHPIDPKKRIPNGVPDLDRPGMILPPQVKRLILLGDGDSERLMTRARVLAAARRHRAQGIEVSIQFAPDGMDFASLAVAA